MASSSVLESRGCVPVCYGPSFLHQTDETSANSLFLESPRVSNQSRTQETFPIVELYFEVPPGGAKPQLGQE